VTEPDDVLTVEEAAELLRIGRNQLYDAIGRNQVPHRRIGRSIRLSRAALVRWLDSCGRAIAQEGH
jgi:excisionase family DNA binding protein